MYYYDINAKITLIEKLITEFRGWNILMMDFDTQLSSLMNNQVLCSNCDPHTNLEIFLPYRITHSAMVDKFIEYDKCNSLIVIDSLNGLLDYFNFYGNNEVSNNDKNVENFKRDAKLNRTTGKHAGYKSLNLIKILFQCHANKEIPVVVTSYQSQSSIDRLMFETISEEAFPYQENNHFRRISNVVSLLEYFQDKDDLFMTILKKTTGPYNTTMAGFPNFPHTRKIIKKP
ncbi:MAG: hypothetical protein H0W19_05970 [Nitrosopumilus sp.]|nr:hypothetical protein [Nitrosopumilus sp.]